MNERTEPAKAFIRLCDSESLSDLDSFMANAGPIDTVELSKLARIDQTDRWRRGDPRPVEHYFDRYPQLRADGNIAVDLIYSEYLLREELAEQPALEEFTTRFPEHATTIADQINFHRALKDTHKVSDQLNSLTQVSQAARVQTPWKTPLPAEFGRYRVIRLLGSGGMGSVYLAMDTKLDRQVALKLPRFDPDIMHAALDRFRREAQIAATFHHPNLCPVYDFGEFEGTLYLTMPYMTGQPLSAKLQVGPLPEKEALRITLKIAHAMSAAHQAGVVHRDLKPSNILLQEDGEPVVMDFGLAWQGLKLDPELKAEGALVGTLAYMAPERLRWSNQELSPVSDVYSLGVVLYEMLTGRLPFEGGWQEVWDQIHSQPPLALSHHVPSICPELDRICLQAMAKDPRDRIASMAAFEAALATFAGSGSIQLETTAPARRPSWLSVMPVAVACLLVFSGWFAWQGAELKWARQQVDTIEEMAEAGRYFEAYDLASRVRKSLPEDAKLTRLMPVISEVLRVDSNPPGARVYVKRFVADSDGSAAEATVLVGTTPLANLEIARADYVVSVEREGFVPFQRTWSGILGGGIDAPIRFETIPINVRLTPLANAKEGMVFVPGGEYRLVAWRRPTDTQAKLDDYFIDRCEVTNAEYQEFVNAGGYKEERYWSHPFVKGGKTLSRVEAMSELKDRTGLPGPRDWSDQKFPDGMSDHPVAGVTWYEAAAYAVFRGKSLPTIFQWEKAARDGMTNPLAQIMPWGLSQGPTDGRANFADHGVKDTIPVGQLEFGMSPFGCYEMAGNVSEWCRNETSEGFIANGSSSAALSYEFGFYGTYPGLFSSKRLGFRCVLNSAKVTGDQGGLWINIDDEVPKYTAKPEAEVRKWFANYKDRDGTRLESQAVEVKETNEWRREKISYLGADGERIPAYLYLPKHFPGPHQVIHLLPAGDVTRGHRTLPQSIEAEYLPFVRSGRAIFSVVLAGYPERDRPRRWEVPDISSREFVDETARQIVDLRRGLDYLETRDDVGVDKIALMQNSVASITIALPSIDTRYRAMVLWGAGINKWSTRVHEEASIVNFAPLVTTPKLLVHGLYDETTPFKTRFAPLYDLLPPPKQKLSYPGGHYPGGYPDYKDLVKAVNTFLDENLGAVHRVGTF